jgi:Helix-turn-helix domain
MHYETFPPHFDLASLVKCYWTLEVPAEDSPARQRIVPDGCMEMAFILGDDIPRYTSDTDYVLQPRAMILGQIIEPFSIQPTGRVNTFAVRFYPYGFANFVTTPIGELANTETPLTAVFGEHASTELEWRMTQANGAHERIEILETFLLGQLRSEATIDHIVKSTVDALLATNGGTPIQASVDGGPARRRQLERKFLKQIRMSPKQLGKVIRMQAAPRMLLRQPSERLTQIAYDSAYYDQSHFIRDFRELTGASPREYLRDSTLTLSTLFFG